MSDRTIRIVDAMCAATNWNRMIPNALDDGERFRWTKKRDAAVARIRKMMAALTDDEKDLIRRKYHPEKLARQLREIGVEPNWEMAP